MTTVLAIRDKVGIHIACDSQATSEVDNSISAAEQPKFISHNEGYIALAGNAFIAETLLGIFENRKFLYDKVITNSINLSITSEDEIRKFFEGLREQIISYYKFPIFPDQEVELLYIDKNKCMKLVFDTTNGLSAFKMTVFKSQDAMIISLGTGGLYARQYINKYWYSGYMINEMLKNSILYAMTKDTYTGGEILIAER